jgi:hypothetical protein
MLPNDPLWVIANSYWTVNLARTLPVGQLNRERMKAWGSLVAVHLIRFGTLPYHVSPFLVLAVISGLEAITSIKFIKAVEGEGLDYLLRWIDLAPDVVLTQTDPLILYVSTTLNTEVSMS